MQTIEKRAVILTALRVEFMAVKHHLSRVFEETHSAGTVYEIGDFEGWEVLVTEIGPGTSSAATEAERAIHFFEPHVFLFVGIAGGLKDVALGDVVAATKVYEYESGKAAKDFQPRFNIQTSAHALVSRAMAEARGARWRDRIPKSDSLRMPEVYVQPIAAGNKVVADKKSETFQFLRQYCSDAVAVEMEGIGALHAVYKNSPVSGMVVRGISDLIDGKAQSDAGGWQKLASENAAAFAFEVLKRFDVKEMPNP